MIESSSQDCQIFIDRLKKADSKSLGTKANVVLSLYPIRDPTSATTVFDDVYSLLDDRLLTKAYRFKFLYFLNTLLSSTKVPSYVIATYIKRLSRLTLVAKPRTLYVIVQLVANLFIRHPILIFLRDRVDEMARTMGPDSTTCTLNDWLKQDPFDVNQTTNLKGSKAMDSYIWEMMPLRFHENKKIAKMANCLNSLDMIDIEFDLSQYID